MGEFPHQYHKIFLVDAQLTGIRRDDCSVRVDRHIPAGSELRKKEHH
jgi:ribosomal protein L15E